MLQEGWQYGNKEYEDSDEELLVDLVAADNCCVIRIEISEMCIDICLRGGRKLFINRDASIFAVRHDPVRCSELLNYFRIASARPCLVVFFLQILISKE